ncbi:MAG: APC family permease [Athalassotoga sp.]|uniref:APC family permease n=1 Tax=Athalassotoga sp. TaxID=2022597 RepID=UPI003CFEFD31
MRRKLKRTLGLYSATMVSIGSMIGGAIFVLAGTVFKIAGPSATLAILLAGIATLLTSLSFAEFSTFIPEAGGGYSYLFQPDKGNKKLCRFGKYHSNDLRLRAYSLHDIWH